MAEMIDDVVVPTEWVSAHTLSGIQNGFALTVQNKGPFPILITTAPRSRPMVRVPASAWVSTVCGHLLMAMLSGFALRTVLRVPASRWGIIMALRPIDGDVGGAGGGTGGEAVAEPMLSEYVSVWGDSRTAQNYSNGTNEPTPVARSWAWWFEALSQRVRMSKNFNFGVSGDSIAQLWARIEGDVANAYGVKPSQVPAGVAVVLIGTNSVNAGTLWQP